MSVQQLQDALRKLGDDGPGFSPLDPAPAVGARPGAVSTGRPGGGAAQSAGGASLSFNESSYAARTRYPARVVWSSDGIFAFEWRPPRLIFGDAENAIELREPPL